MRLFSTPDPCASTLAVNLKKKSGGLKKPKYDLQKKGILFDGESMQIVNELDFELYSKGRVKKNEGLH